VGGGVLAKGNLPSTWGRYNLDKTPKNINWGSSIAQIGCSKKGGEKEGVNEGKKKDKSFPTTLNVTRALRE